MNQGIAPEEFDLLRNLVEKECGIALSKDKVYLIETRLARLIAENSCTSYGDLYTKAKNDSKIRDKIIDAMTTNETLWFRDVTPYNILKEVIFPEYEEKLKIGGKIKIWSAACSTGQEPYSIMISFLEYIKGRGLPQYLTSSISITATDISPSVIAVAKIARYNGLSLSRGLPEEYKDSYFNKQGNVWALNDEVKKSVSFQVLNLQNSFSSLGKYDIIFLRNVAIYFSTEFKKDLYSRLANSLNPNGNFFLGAAESLGGLNNDFKMKQHGRGVYYKLIT